MAYPLGYTRYVYVTLRLCVRVLCKNDGTLCCLSRRSPGVWGNASFGPVSLISTLPSRCPSRPSRCTTFALISAPATDLGTFPAHRHGFRSRYRALAARFSSVTQMAKRRAARPTFAGWISFIVLLLLLSSFRRAFDRVRFCCHPSRSRADDDNDDNDFFA